MAQFYFLHLWKKNKSKYVYKKTDRQ
jgi:hypothetical protein